MKKQFFWHNRFNGVEEGGPFESIAAAQQDVVNVMNCVQNGFAFDIVIYEGGIIRSSGHIKGGRWIEGEFSETKAEAKARLG